MPNDKGSNAPLQEAIWHAMSALRTQSSLPEQSRTVPIGTRIQT